MLAFLFVSLACPLVYFISCLLSTSEIQSRSPDRDPRQRHLDRSGLGHGIRIPWSACAESTQNRGIWRIGSQPRRRIACARQACVYCHSFRRRHGAMLVMACRVRLFVDEDRDRIQSPACRGIDVGAEALQDPLTAPDLSEPCRLDLGWIWRLARLLPRRTGSPDPGADKAWIPRQGILALCTRHSHFPTSLSTGYPQGSTEFVSFCTNDFFLSTGLKAFHHAGQIPSQTLSSPILSTPFPHWADTFPQLFHRDITLI